MYGVVSPHPPIILPEIGGSKLEEVKATVSALKKCRKELSERGVNHIFIISPHTDHGFNVPLFYLQDDVPSQNIKQVLVGSEDYSWYFKYGNEIGEELNEEKHQWAIIASADLSHALKSDGSYQFHPDGPKLDKKITECFKNFDPETLLELDREFIQNGAECGLRSILFLMGAFKFLENSGKKVSSRMLSYEGPWGVGYMVGDLKLNNYH